MGMDVVDTSMESTQAASYRSNLTFPLFFAAALSS